MGLFIPDLKFQFFKHYEWQVKVKSLGLTKHRATKTSCSSFSITPWRRTGEWRCSSTNSYPWHFVEVSSQLHASTALLPGKELPVPIGYEAG